MLISFKNESDFNLLSKMKAIFPVRFSDLTFNKNVRLIGQSSSILKQLTLRQNVSYKLCKYLFWYNLRTPTQKVRTVELAEKLKFILSKFCKFFDFHLQLIFFAQLRNFFHHFCFMVEVKCFLTFPTIYKQ